MAEWFPAIRGYLAERGIRLPRPYPCTGRTVLGSALAALLAASLLGAAYTTYLAVRVVDTATELASARLEEAARTATQTVYRSVGAVTAGSDAVENALALVAAVTADVAENAVYSSSQVVTAGSHSLEQKIAAFPRRIHAWLTDLLTPSPEVKTALEQQRQEYERAKRGKNAPEERTGFLGPAPKPDAPDGSSSPEQAWKEDDWREIVAISSQVPLPPHPLYLLGRHMALAVPWPVEPIPRPAVPFPNNEDVRHWRDMAGLPAPLDLAPWIPTEEATALWRSMTALSPLTSIAPLPPSADDVRQWRVMAALPPPLSLASPPPVDEDLRQWRSMLHLPTPLDLVPRLPSSEDIRQWRVMAAVPPFTPFAPLPPSADDVRQWQTMAALPAPLTLSPPLPSAEDIRQWRVMAAVPPFTPFAPLPPSADDVRQWQTMAALPAPLTLSPPLPSAGDIRQWRVMAAMPSFIASLPPSANDVRQWQTMAALPAPLTLSPPLPSAGDIRQWQAMIAFPAPQEIAPPPPTAQDVRQWLDMIALLDLPVPSPSADKLRQWDERAARASSGSGSQSQSLVPPDAVAEVREAVSRNALPYLEKPDAPVADVVKQVDFALFQTVARLRLEDGRIFLLGGENRGEGEQQRLFQRMKIYLPKLEGDAAATFAGLLAGTLEVWSDRAALSRPAWNRLILTVDGLETHDLRLEVVGDEFLLPPLEGGPRLTIVLDDMGANPKALEDLLELDVPVTVAIWPRSRHAAETARRAHAAGREVLVHQPMEPVQAPYVDAGPGAITLHTPPERVREMLAENLKQVPFASGLNNHMGSRFTQDPRLCDVVCEVLSEAGLFALDSVTHTGTVLYDTARRHGLPAYRRDVFLDDGPRTVKSVLEKLREAESVARKNGQAVAIGHPHPETLTALRQWCATRDMNIQIVPLRHLEQRGALLTPADIDASRQK